MNDSVIGTGIESLPGQKSHTIILHKRRGDGWVNVGTVTVAAIVDTTGDLFPTESGTMVMVKRYVANRPMFVISSDNGYRPATAAEIADNMKGAADGR